jgi:hypothetical protein
VQVATLGSDPLRWREYWRHQRRVAVTYRVCDPLGFAGAIVTHGVTASGSLLLWAAFSSAQAILPAMALFAVTMSIRWWTARQAAQLLDFRIPRLPLAVLVGSFVETACWLLAWLSSQIWWSGKMWRVSPDGKLRL